MKKLCLLLALLLLLCGCGAREPERGPALSEQVAPPETAHNIEVTWAEEPEETAQPQAPAAPEPEPESDLPEVDPASWELILANAENSIGE